MTELGELEVEDVVRQLARIAEALEQINDSLKDLISVVREFE